MKVECKECGKIYEIGDKERVSDYSCECGGSLRLYTTIGEVLGPLCIAVFFSFLLGFSQLTMIGVILLIITFFNRKSTSMILKIILSVYLIIAALIVGLVCLVGLYNLIF